MRAFNVRLNSYKVGVDKKNSKVKKSHEASIECYDKGNWATADIM